MKRGPWLVRLASACEAVWTFWAGLAWPRPWTIALLLCALACGVYVNVYMRRLAGHAPSGDPK